MKTRMSREVHEHICVGYMCRVCEDADRAYAVAELTARAERAERERDEAREWVRRITAEQRVLTCVYCGHAYPPGSPTHGAKVLTDHIRVCPKHPLRAAEAQLEKAQVAHKAAWESWQAAERQAEALAKALEQGADLVDVSVDEKTLPKDATLIGWAGAARAALAAYREGR